MHVYVGLQSSFLSDMIVAKTFVLCWLLIPWNIIFHSVLCVLIMPLSLKYLVVYRWIMYLFILQNAELGFNILLFVMISGGGGLLSFPIRPDILNFFSCSLSFM